jgi:hypothetical protein
MGSPSIRLSIVANPPGLLVETTARTREFTLPALRNLNDVKRDLPNKLRAFRQAIGVSGVTLNSREADQAMEDLDIAASTIADLLIEGSPDFSDIASFENAVAELISPALRQLGSGETPTIEIVEPGSSAQLSDAEIVGLLPVELLRFAEPATGDLLAGPRDRRLRRYLGMRAVTVRRYVAASGGEVIGNRQVPVAVLSYDGGQLRGPAAQAAFFRAWPEVFAGRFWPAGQVFPINDLSLSPLLPYQESALARSLTTEILAVTGLADPNHPPYNGCILHLCCHYYSAQINGIDQAAPFLCFDDLRKNISVAALRGALASAPKHAVPGAQPASHYAQALVMLNACETAAAAPFAGGILHFLLSRGFRHVIASETLVPDSLSSAFASQFYLALLRGESVGEGLLSARETLVNLHDNPGGLLYTLYGDPNLRLGTDPIHTAPRMVEGTHEAYSDHRLPA